MPDPALTPSDRLTAFCGNPLDRADKRRADPALLTRGLDAPDARLLLMARDRALTSADGLPFLVNPAEWAPACDTVIFLGEAADGPSIFAGRIEADHEGIDLSGLAEDGHGHPPEGVRFRDLRGAAMKALSLTPGQPQPMLGPMAHAKSMLDWHSRHRFCANCGAETAPIKGGYQRDCSNCGASHFPRTDPVVIMLALHGEGEDEMALIGHGAKMPPGFMSALAGFVEPGETLEEAVARELYEEAGVTAHSVRYVTSQPWPWPSSLMMGCTARTDNPALTLDLEEVTDARWVSKDDMRQALIGKLDGVILPPPLAIAHRLISLWVEGKL